MNQPVYKVLLFSFDYPPFAGGISRLCSMVAQIFSKKNINITVLSQYSKSDGYKAEQEIRVIPKRILREVKAWNLLLKLKCKYRKLICVSGIWYPEGLIALIANLHPLIIFAHGNELLPARQLWRRSIWSILCRWVLSSADLVIANSEYTRQLVTHKVPKAQVITIPLA